MLTRSQKIISRTMATTKTEEKTIKNRHKNFFMHYLKKYRIKLNQEGLPPLDSIIIKNILFKGKQKIIESRFYKASVKNFKYALY